MPDNDGGWQDVQQDEGWKDVQAQPAAAPKAPQSSFWQRLKLVAGLEPEKPDTSHMEGGEGYDPYARLPQQLNAAQTAAGLAAGVGEGPMGLPAPNVTGLVSDVASAGGEAAKAIGRGVTRPLQNFHYEPPDEISIAHPLAALGKMVRNVPSEAVSDVTKAPMEAPRLGPELNPPGESMKIPARMPKAPAPSMIAGTSTSPEAVAEIPQSALPAIAKGAMPSAGDMTSTGAMPASPLGTPEPETPVDPVAAAIKQGIAAKLPTRMPTPKGDAIAKGLGEISGPASTGSEGRPATWTNETVTQLAAKGNRDAISQAVRRGLGLPENARYVMGDADYPRAVLNPKETTLFTPEGTPIRNTDNPIAQNPSSRARIQQPEMPAARVEPPAPAETPETFTQGFTPENMKTAGEAARETAPNFKVTPPPEKAPTQVVRAPREQLGNFDPDTLEQAKAEVGALHSQWSSQERPGRFFSPDRDEVGVAQRVEMTHSTSSARPQLETEFPWLKQLPKMTAEKLRAAVESGKGVEYTRLLNEAGKHIQAAKQQAGPILAEFADELAAKAQAIASIDPELAQTLRDVSAGKYSGMTSLSRFIRDRLDEAASAEEFDKAVNSLSEGAAEEHPTGPAARGSTPQETELASPEGILPGMQDAVAQQRIAAGMEQGRQLTEQMNRPPESIESAAGEMERKSPLFRDTEANPQNDLFRKKE